MEFNLTTLARHTIGLSTPAYLYLSDAVVVAIDAGRAAGLLATVSGVPGQTAALEGCRLPTVDDPARRLCQLTQSTRYHRALAGNSDLFLKTFYALRDASGIPFPSNRLPHADPSTALALFDPLSFRLPVGLRQVRAAFQCYQTFCEIHDDDPEDATNITDTYMPQLHLWMGALMLFQVIEKRWQWRLDVGDALSQWEKLVTAFMAMTRATGNFHRERIAGVGSHFVRPGETVAILLPEENREHVSVFSGITLCVPALEDRLLQRVGTGAGELQELREEVLMPILKRYSEIDAETKRRGENPQA